MAFMIPTIITHGIYTGIINTISSATVNTCGLVKSIYIYQNPNVTKLIKSLDIERRLELISAVINSIDKESNDKIDTSLSFIELEKSQVHILNDTHVNKNMDPIELCLKYLHEIIRKINLILLNINKKVANHEKKWFSSWRTLNIQNLLDDLELNSYLLNNRFDDLTKIAVFLRNI